MTRPKITPKNRNRKAVEAFRAKEAEKKEVSRAVQLDIIRLENVYVTNMADAHYYMARYNMLVEQINSEDIKENIDGCPKTKEMVLAEAQRLKIQASSKYRSAWFAKVDLNKAGMSDEEVDKVFIDYTQGAIVRESYDEKYHKQIGAHFVKV